MTMPKVTHCPECKSKDLEQIEAEKPVFDKDTVLIGYQSIEYRCQNCKYEFGEVEFEDSLLDDASDSAHCPNCGKETNRWNDEEEYWRCKNCRFKFDETGKEYNPCTHDSFRVWIVETRKVDYQRNEYTGELEEVYSRAWESDWSTISCECNECGKSLDYETINKATPRPEGWRPKQNVYEVETVETPTIRFIHHVLADNKEEARNKALNGQSEVTSEKELGCDHKEVTRVQEVIII